MQTKILNLKNVFGLLSLRFILLEDYLREIVESLMDRLDESVIDYVIYD